MQYQPQSASRLSSFRWMALLLAFFALVSLACNMPIVRLVSPEPVVESISAPAANEVVSAEIASLETNPSRGKPPVVTPPPTFIPPPPTLTPVPTQQRLQPQPTATLALQPTELAPSSTIDKPPATPGPIVPADEATQPEDSILADTWSFQVRQWEPMINQVSLEYGIDPDLVAAIVFAESSGRPYAVSYAGAVGLMGIMSADVGFTSRPNEAALKDPETNLSWGTAIITQIIRQSGGDLHSALAAYNGGWRFAPTDVPQGYATEIYHNYGRAVASRIGMDPDIADRWTIAISIERGYITPDSLLLAETPTQAVPFYGEHIIYSGVDRDTGRPYHVKGYAVPIELAESPTQYGFIDSD